MRGSELQAWKSHLHTRGPRGGSGAAEGGVPRLGGGQPQDGAPLLGPLALAQRQTVLCQVEAVEVGLNVL